MPVNGREREWGGGGGTRTARLIQFFAFQHHQPLTHSLSVRSKSEEESEMINETKSCIGGNLTKDNLFSLSFLSLLLQRKGE